MERLRFLDSARAIAVLYVIFFHTIFITPIEYPRFVHSFAQSGGSGVILFFIVSGFSLCLTAPRHQSSALPGASYAIARIFRIVPLYYFMLVLTIWRDAMFRDRTYVTEKILAAVFFTFNLNPAFSKGIVWASWTLGVEVIFYAVFPLFYRYFNDIYKLMSGVIAFTFLTYVANLYYIPTLDESLRTSYSYMMMPRNFAIFLIGMTTFHAYRWLDQTIIENRKSIGIFVLTLGCASMWILIMSFRYTWGKVMFVDFGILQAMAYSIIVLGIALYPWRFLVNAVTNFYSKVCYSAYLWHPFIIWAMKPFYIYVYGFSLPVVIKLLVSFAVTLGVVSAVSQVSFDYIERPGQRLGKKLLARLEKKSLTKTAQH